MWNLVLLISVSWSVYHNILRKEEGNMFSRSHFWDQETEARWTGLPKEYLTTRYSLTKHFSCFLAKEKGSRGKKEWKLIVFHLRGFCINTRPCKMWGSNERHFLLRAPTSFEKNYISREAKIVRRALIIPSSETILQKKNERPRR